MTTDEMVEVIERTLSCTSGMSHSECLMWLAEKLSAKSLPQLGILLSGENQPDAARSPHLDVPLDVLPRLESSHFAPALEDLDDLPGVGKGESQRQCSPAVGLKEAYLPSESAHEVHEHAVISRLPSLVHRLHEVGHRGIVGEIKAKLSTNAQAIENNGRCEVLQAVFDPDWMQSEMELNLPDSLRHLADAIEAGQIYGKLAGFVPWGFKTDHRDQRCHLLVKLHVAAEIRKPMEVNEK